MQAGYPALMKKKQLDLLLYQLVLFYINTNKPDTKNKKFTHGTQPITSTTVAPFICSTRQVLGAKVASHPCLTCLVLQYHPLTEFIRKTTTDMGSILFPKKPRNPI